MKLIDHAKAIATLGAVHLLLQAAKHYLKGEPMADIVGGALGPETKYDVAFVGGALKVTVNYAGQQASAGLNVSVSGAQIIDALAQKLTNPTEKELLLGLEAIIKSIP